MTISANDTKSNDTKSDGTKSDDTESDDTKSDDTESDDTEIDNEQHLDSDTDPTPDEGEEGIDDSGQSFLLLLREWVGKMESRRQIQQELSGHTPPEQNDVSMEYRAWLSRQTNPILNEGGRLINPDDETGYSFLYHIYKSIWHDYQNNSFNLQYWWRRGAPIDPESYVKSLVVRSLIKSPYVLSTTRSDGSVTLDFYM